MKFSDFTVFMYRGVASLGYFFVSFLMSLGVFASSFQLDVIKYGESSTGIAFFTESDGMAVTAYHVVEDADEIYAKIKNKIVPATLIGFDAVLDVAIIKVENSTKDALKFASVVSVGDIVFIENSFGSIINKGMNNFTTDIDIFQGLSGSPVMCGGSVCGVVTSFEKCTGNAIAVRVGAILKKYDQLLNGAKLQKKTVDFYVMNVTHDVINMLGVNINAKEGVLVTKTQNQFLQIWDIITHINGKPVNSVESLQRILSELYEEEQTKMHIIRAKKKQVVII